MIASNTLDSSSGEVKMGRRQNYSEHGNVRYNAKKCIMKNKKTGRRSRSEDEEQIEPRKKPRMPTENIKVMMINARGLDEVTEHDIVSLIKNQKPEVMGVLETHLREEDGSRKVNIPEGYSKFEVRRSDLDDDKDGGGLMIMYKKTQGIKIEEKKLKIRKKENDLVSKERAWLTVKTKTEKLAIGFVYVAAENRSETNKEKFSKLNDSIYEVLDEDIRKLRKEGFKIMLNGDHNGWVGCGQGGIPGNRKEVNTNGRRFMDFLDRSGMVHLNGTSKCTGLYTRHSSNSSTVLDYVSVRKEDLPLVKSVFVDENSSLGGNSDHVFLITTLELVYTSGPSATTKTRQATKWDMDEQTYWNKFQDAQRRRLGELPESAWDTVEPLGGLLNDILVGSMQEGIGEKCVKEPIKKQFTPTVRRELKVLKELRSVWRKSRSKVTQNPTIRSKQTLGENELMMKKQETKVEEVLSKFWRGSRAKVFDKLSEGGAKSTKLFWSYVVNKTRGVLPSPSSKTQYQEK